MTTKERIKAEIDHLDEEDLEELYNVVKRLAQSKKERREPSFLSKLRRIKIDAPEDFSANLGYVSGEKRVEC